MSQLAASSCRSEVTRILRPYVERVVVVSPDDTGISSARAKTDKLDARTLASLLWKGELAQQAEISYRRMVADQKAGGPARPRVGASATPERAEI